MSALEWLPSGRSEPRVIWISAALALMVEAIVLTAVGWQSHWLAHPQKTGLEPTKFIEAQVFQVPREAHLVEEKKEKTVPAHKEAALSKAPNKGRVAKPGENKIQEENQTESGPKSAPTHGPVAIFAPPPVIPAYLRDKDIHASVVIDFYVNALGQTTPRLVSSSGDQELDAIAIATAGKWRFRPAEKDHKPLDAKVRLRIVFEVQ